MTSYSAANSSYQIRSVILIVLVSLFWERSIVNANQISQLQELSKTTTTIQNLPQFTPDASNFKEEAPPTNITQLLPVSSNELKPTTPNVNLQFVQEPFSSSTIKQDVSDVPTSTEIAITTTTALPDTKNTCPMPDNLDDLTQNQFSSILTNDCRYDKVSKPHTDDPLEVGLQIDIRHIEAADQLQLRVHLNVQYSYLDERLRYDAISPRRGYMLGEDVLKSRIWVPHLIIMNEREVSIMGLEGKDIFVSISPKGEVSYSYRISAIIYCWMDLKKFPFDEQICNLNFQSWTYNASQLMLKWVEPEPVTVASPLHLTEFSLEEFSTLESLRPAPVKGGFTGNFSTLTFRFKIAREVGYYIMDYFLPSIMLVCTSWVTFWLQADNTAPRVTLGTSTMLSFITLASGQTKTLPKVSYIKVSEIWFLGCSLFIFASMVEFAFVNIIWRRRKKVELKKVNSKYILKSTLTPRLARREFQQSSSMSNLYKARSCTSLNTRQNKEDNNENSYNNYLTVHSFATIPKITTESDENLVTSKQESSTAIDMPESDNSNHSPTKPPKWTTMTPQEVAIWIDKRSRILFPVAFLVFNILFWSIVLCW